MVKNKTQQTEEFRLFKKLKEQAEIKQDLKALRMNLQLQVQERAQSVYDVLQIFI